MPVEVRVDLGSHPLPDLAVPQIDRGCCVARKRPLRLFALLSSHSELLRTEDHGNEDADEAHYDHCPGLAFVSLPFFFHTVLGRNATDTGILLTAWPLALATVAAIAGSPADRHHAGLLGAIGLTSMTTGLVLTALLPPDPSTANIMWRLVLCGAGFGIFSSPNNRLMMDAVPREKSGSAGGIIATARTLGQTMGAALVALVFGLFDFSGAAAPPMPPAPRSGWARASPGPRWWWAASDCGTDHPPVQYRSRDAGQFRRMRPSARKGR